MGFLDVKKPLKTNQFKIYIPKRPDLEIFSEHVKGVRVEEYPMRDPVARIWVDLIHSFDFSNVFDVLTPEDVETIHLDITQEDRNVPIHTLVFKPCIVESINRRFDYHVKEDLLVTYVFAVNGVEVEEKKGVRKRKRW